MNLVGDVGSAEMTNVRSLIEDFTTRLTSILEDQALERARVVVENALGRQGSGRLSTLAYVSKRGSRRKAPIQLCPVPGCRNPAAPVYGMVCAKHKDVSKAKIKAYRERRRAKKLKAAK